jgi:microfibrillar-associated protein 1
MPWHARPISHLPHRPDNEVASDVRLSFVRYFHIFFISIHPIVTQTPHTHTMPPKRMTANPLAPLRYRPGKAVGQEESSSEEEESGSESENEQQNQPPKTTTAPPKATSFPKFNSSLTKADLERRRQEAQLLRQQNAELEKQGLEGFETASETGDSASDDESASDEDDEDEDESEEEAPTRRFVAPSFVPKSQRKNLAAPVQDEEAIAAEQERVRKEKADALLQAQIDKDIAARAAGRRAWDDEDPDAIEDVDDTDALDPEAELAAWKLRELRRVKREREAIEVAEKEREEIERRRNLTAEQREAEDAAHIAAQKEEKEGRGQAGFMQKYHHKGAFFQDDEELAEISKRDIMGAKFQDDSGNREILPQYMQIRDMTKLGRKGRTKYKDLKAEDTGRWGAEDDRRGGPGYGGDRYKDREGATGANAAVVGERRRRDDDRGGRDEKRTRYD